MLSVTNNFNDSQLKHNVAHEFGLNHHKFLSSWLESLTSLRNHCAHHARVWNRAYPLKPATPQVMPNKWITNFKKINDLIPLIYGDKAMLYP